MSPAAKLVGLRVQTARVSYGGPGRLDITARGADPIGGAWAPPWSIITPIVGKGGARDQAQALVAAGERSAAAAIVAGRPGEAELVRACARERADLLLSATWGRYVPAYRGLLDESAVARPDAWAWLADRAAEGALVIGVCFCAGEEARARRCHRFLWADYLETLGAEYQGELS